MNFGGIVGAYRRKPWNADSIDDDGNYADDDDAYYFFFSLFLFRQFFSLV